MTLTPHELATYRLGDAPEIVAIGRKTPSEMSVEISRASAIFFPSTLESFGYPLAEARVNRIPVLTTPSVLAAEIAGDAAVYYETDSPTALAQAMFVSAEARLPEVDFNPFDPDRYFGMLFDRELGRASVR